jgi:hypothetical protein
MDDALLSYGGLGILALASMLAAIRVYRDKQKQDERHRKEMQVMIDRYVEGHKTVADRYHSFAEKVHELAVRLESKIDRRS